MTFFADWCFECFVKKGPNAHPFSEFQPAFGSEKHIENINYAQIIRILSTL